MKIGFTDIPDTYKFSNKHKFELIFFKWGVIISNTPRKIKEIEVYDSSTDSVKKGKGHKRTSNFYKVKNVFPYIGLDSKFTQTIPQV